MTSTVYPPIEGPASQVPGEHAARPPQGPDAAGAESSEGGEKGRWLPFFPNYILDEVIAWYVMLGVLIVLASLLPAGLEEKADPLKTPAHIKPEWYFLSLYQALKLVPRIVGILAPMAGVVILLFLPFIDRNPQVRPRRRPVAIGLAVIVIAAIVALTVWGQIS